MKKDRKDRQKETENGFDTIEQLIDALDQCRLCRERFGYEPRPVHWGNPGARIMHISQAPGKKVHECGRPFSDLSGRRLREKWYCISEEQFYNPDNFYFTTMGHCFPGKGKNNYDKKPPRICYDLWTKHEIEMMDSCDLYLIIGQEAASRIFPGRKLRDLVFEDLTLHSKPCYVLPHPSPLNIRWYRDNPEFESVRIPEIRKKIHEVLNSDRSAEDIQKMSGTEKQKEEREEQNGSLPEQPERSGK